MCNSEKLWYFVGDIFRYLQESIGTFIVLFARLSSVAISIVWSVDESFY